MRLGSRYLLCTPTMVSKGDPTAEDRCLSDLEGNVLVGDRMRTSEILPHLAIYRATREHSGGALPFAVCYSIRDNGCGAAQWLRSGV